MVSEQTIKELQDAYKEECGIILSFSEAKEILLGWVGYFNLLAKIDQRPEAQKS